MTEALQGSYTPRGFALVNFLDRYGHQCSIQKSSLMGEEAIWFGVDDAAPQIMASQAQAHGVSTTETCGWVPYPVPDAVLLTTRMHLTQAQVKALLPILKHFAKTGELPTL